MMLATETRVQVSILGYLSSDLKEAVRSQQETGDRRQETGDRRQETGDRRQETGDRRLFLFIVPTPHTPHPTSPLPHFPTPHFPTSPRPHTLHPTPYFPEKAYSAIQAKKNETFALRISPDW
jgi:DNA gyrase subunit A